MRIFLLLILLPIFFCQKPSIKNALRNQVVIDLKNNIVPKIYQKIKDIRIPDIHSGKLHVDNIHIHINPINPNLIGIKFIPNSNTFQFSATGISMQGGAHACYKILFVRLCCGIGTSVGDSGFVAQISLFSHNSKPSVRVDRISVHANGIGIRASCGFLSPVINLLINLLKGGIINFT